MKRRSFLASMLALGAAPALAIPGRRFVPSKAGILLPKNGVLRIYSGGQTLLAELAINGPMAASGGIMRFPEMSGPVLRSGSVNSFDILGQDGEVIVSGPAGESGLIFSTKSVTHDQRLSVTNFALSLDCLSSDGMKIESPAGFPGPSAQ